MTKELLQQALNVLRGCLDHPDSADAIADLEAAIAQPASREPSITLDFKQATELLELFAGEPSEITLLVGDGHSGRGVYAHYTDYQEEGAEYLGVSEPEALPAQAATAQPEQPTPSRYGSNDMQDLILADLAQPEQPSAQDLSDAEIIEIASDLTLYSDYHADSNQAEYIDPVKFARALQAATLAERGRCASLLEKLTAHKRMVRAAINGVKPEGCEYAAAIRRGGEA